MRVLRFQYKPTFVEPACRWQPPESIKEQVEAWQGEARLPRPKRPGGRFGKRPRPLAIEDGLVEEAAVDPGPQLLALEDVQPDALVLVPPPRKRQRVGRLPPPDNAVVEEDDASLFTPQQVLNTVRCEARVWGGGLGGQCTNRKSLSSRFCKLHGRDGGPSHGCVDGPIPPAKLKAFRSYRLLHRVEDPCVVGVDYF